MTNFIVFAVGAGFIFLSACGSVGHQYLEPSQAGLSATSQFPTGDDVCVVLAANDVTRQVTANEQGLIGCPSHETGAISDRIDEGFQIAGAVQSWTVLERDQVINSGVNATSAKHLINQTTVFFDPFHGTQVAYFDANGSEWLWYPGNRLALKGFWKVPDESGPKNICFQYPTSGINPATGVPGPEWECTSLSTHRHRIVEQADGDIFKLLSGKIPFVMKKRTSYTLEDLIE